MLPVALARVGAVLIVQMNHPSLGYLRVCKKGKSVGRQGREMGCLIENIVLSITAARGFPISLVLCHKCSIHPLLCRERFVSDSANCSTHRSIVIIFIIIIVLVKQR